MKNPKFDRHEIYYDGPGLFRWLKDRGIRAHVDLDENLARAVHRWSTGERATEPMVDRICCQLGLGSHLTAIPHDLIVKGRELIDPDYTPPGLEGLVHDGRGAWVRKEAA
jgi:hypothetical protein